MTNLIGMMLVILNVETVEIMATNDVGVSCKDAGCTFTNCLVWHTTQTVDVAATRQIVTVGTRDVMPSHYYLHKNAIVATAPEILDTPLYRIVTQKAAKQPILGCVIYNDVTWIEPVEEKP